MIDPGYQDDFINYEFPRAGYKTLIFINLDVMFTLLLLICAYIMHRVIRQL